MCLAENWDDLCNLKMIGESCSVLRHVDMEFDSDGYQRAQKHGSDEDTTELKAWSWMFVVETH